MRAFVLEGIVRECLAVVRSLGKRGVVVDVGDPNRVNPARFSKYVSKFYAYPDPKTRPEDFICWLINHVKRHHYDMVFPLNDHTYEACVRYQDELLAWTHVAVNSLEKFEIARDKEKTLRYATKSNVPIPKTWFPNDKEDIKKILPELPSYPIFIKPARSSGSRGARVIRNEHELYENFEILNNSYGRMLIQEYIPGEKILDVPMIFNMKEEIRGALVSNRVRMFPVKGGPNVAGHAVINEPIRAMAVRLMESIGWKGVCLVEFKVDERDGIPKLMEINPRFWGSTQLGISAGIDWPWMLFKAAVFGDCEEIREYRTDKLVRWLIPGEVMYLLTRKGFGTVWPDFFRFLDRNTEYYVLRKGDILPVFGLLLAIITKLFDARLIKYYVLRK